MSSTTRSRLGIGASIAGAGALALTALVAVAPSASAIEAPSFAYQTKNVAQDQVLRTNDAVGTVGTAVEATGSGYQVYGYDASWDGKTWAACMGSGTATADPYDRTYALVLTHTVDGTPETTQTRVLSTFCETAPVVSGDGSKVYWLADDHVYQYAATYDGATGAISGTATVVSSNQFITAHNSAGDATEQVVGFTVSTDGSAAAAIYRGATTYRIKASRLATAAPWPDYAAKTYTVSSVSTNVPQPVSFVFTDADTLVWTLTNTSSVPTKTIYGVKSDLPLGDTNANLFSAANITNLNGLYDLQDYSADGGTTTTFFGWKDVYDAGSYVDSEFGSTDDPAGNVAPATWTPRTDGATTFRYVPVAGALPALEQAVNRAPAHPEMRVSTGTSAATSILRGGKVGYFSANYYLTDPTDPEGTNYLKANAAETDKGTLTGCVTATCAENEFTAFTAVPTSGKNVYAIGTQWYNGTSPVLTRNTTLRWTFAGDFFTAPSDPTTAAANVRIYARPVITIKKSISGSYTTVYGYASRTYGVAASLQRCIQAPCTRAAQFRTVATQAVTFNAGGTYAGFNFGRKLLPHGTYRVVVAGSSTNGSWVTGVQKFAL